MRELPIKHVKGDTFSMRGTIKVDGTLRRLVEKNDLLEFSISTEDDLPGIITRVSGAGIEAADDGSYIITIAPSEIERDILPESAYRYAFRMTFGDDTDKRYTIFKGDFELVDSPFALT